MKLVRLSFLAAALLAGGLAAAAGFLEREVTFSEAEIQAALDKTKPQELSYGGLITVALNEPPRIRLDGDDGRARVDAGVDLETPGRPPIRIDFSGRAGIRYDDRSKAFYLENPVADSVTSPTLGKEAAPAARLAITQLMASYFRSKPVYVLREDGSPQELTARWLLKSVRIEAGRVVAVLSPV